MSATALIQASDILTDPIKRQEFAAAVTDIALSYNRCKRCHRKIKAPQEYGRVCARKIKPGCADAAGDEVLHCGAKTSFPLGRTD